MDELYITLGKKEGRGSIVEKRSEFIGYAAHVENEKEALEFISQIKHRHGDAKHNVYAYMLKNNNISRYSDDGEPQGSAGIPVLEIIKKGGFTDAAIVVTRYFGGVLLGVGGLSRAYGTAARLAVEDAGIVKYELFEILKFSCDYKQYPKILKEITKFSAKADPPRFEEDVHIRLALLQKLVHPFCERLSELTGGKIKIENEGFCYNTR